MTFGDPHIKLTDEEAEAVRFCFPKSTSPELTVAVRAEMAALEYVRNCLAHYRDSKLQKAGAAE